MQSYEFFRRLESVISDAQTAVFATIDENGIPRMRWLTPTTLKGRPGYIYSVAEKGSRKTREVEKNPKVEWMIQSKSLDRIINVRGVVSILDNPSIKTEILQTIGKRLNIFWKVSTPDPEFVVMETVIEEAVCFEPLKGKSENISFKGGD
ncbi:MAG: pyridoxamine 5'-phosphate oxidase family protein [Clostridiales bacterium]|nr:pyridoxamine 5'-phosphate oxidase family protein [Clostridiales bacterium]